MNHTCRNHPDRPCAPRRRVCVECVRAADRARMRIYYARILAGEYHVEVVGERKCSTCDYRGPVSSFPRNRYSTTGHDTRCYECKRAIWRGYDAKWRATHKAERREAMRRYWARRRAREGQL